MQDRLLRRPGRLLLRAVSGQRLRRQLCEYMGRARSASPELLQGGRVGRRAVAGGQGLGSGGVATSRTIPHRARG